MHVPSGKAVVSLVVPFYNEIDVVDRFFAETLPVLDAIDDVRFEVVCVNDGSHDATLDRLVAASARDARIRVIDLTRNFGKEAALTAGLDEARGDAVISLDGDLQDPPALIPLMIEHWRAGAEVVAAKRTNRASDTFAKRAAATLYYRVHNALSDVKIPENVGDFRLMDRRVVTALRSLPERRRFMKGLFAWLGYRTTIVCYERPSRAAGHTKFSGWRLWNLALEGITSFSTVPLRSWTYIGMTLASFALLYAIATVIRTIWFGNPVPGYASIFSAMLFLGGIELVGIGVIGEYIGRIYDETKARPVYLVRRRYHGREKISTLPVAARGAPRAAVRNAAVRTNRGRKHVFAAQARASSR